jgi:hypothetical protein
VYGFNAEIDGRKYVGSVKEKEEAFNTYDDAIASGHGAALLEKNKKGKLEATIGNLPPGSYCNIEVKFVLVARYLSERLVLSLPQGLFAQSFIQDWWVRGEGMTKFDIQVTMDLPSAVRGVESPSHPVEVEFDGTKASVKLARAADASAQTPWPASDFIVWIKMAGETASRAWVQKSTATDAGQPRAGLLAVVPRTTDSLSPILPEIIFVVDRSNSMQGAGITSAKSAMNLFLRGLPAGCRFNILSFGSSYRFLWPEGSVPYDDANLEKATTYVSGMIANMLGTNLMLPLKALYAMAIPKGFQRIIFLLTDGEVADPRQVVSLVQQNVSKGQVFTIGLGSAVSFYLVRELAQQGKGLAEFCLISERLETKVMRLLKLAVSHRLDDCKLTWQSARGEPIPTDPDNPPITAPLFFDQPAVFATVFEPSDKCPEVAVISGVGPNKKEYEFRVPVEETKEGMERMIEVVAGQQMIAALEAKTSSNRTDAKWVSLSDQQFKEKCRAIGLRLGLVTQYTSFVVVDERDEATEGTMEKRTLHTNTATTQVHHVQPVVTSKVGKKRIPRKGSGGGPVYKGFAAANKQVELPDKARRKKLSRGPSSQAKCGLEGLVSSLKKTGDVKERRRKQILPQAQSSSVADDGGGGAIIEPIDLLCEAQSVKSLTIDRDEIEKEKEEKQSVDIKMLVGMVPRQSRLEAKFSKKDSKEQTKGKKKKMKKKKVESSESDDEDEERYNEEKEEEAEEDEEEEEEDYYEEEATTGTTRSSLTSARAAAVVPPRFGAATLSELALLQKASGPWELTDSFLKCLQVTDKADVDRLDAALQSLPSSSQQDNKKMLWATALAIAFLYKHLKAFEDDWQMLVTKAKTWLLSQLGGDTAALDNWIATATAALL